MFNGTGVALVTPFKDNFNVDYDALEHLVEYVIKGGVEFLVALGTTAETPTLSVQEKLEILDCILRVNDKKLPVVVGIGGNNTQEVIKTIQQYPLEEVAGILSVVPYYNKPNQEAIYKHFKAIAESTDKEIILYNVPGRTGSNMGAETTLRLANDFSNIVAVKEASGNMQQSMELAKRAPQGFSVLSGDDDLAMAQVAMGFKGVISVAANSFPSTFSNMIRLTQSENLTEARKLHYQMLNAIHLLFEEGNPTGIKSILSQKKICGNNLRLPLIPSSTSLYNKLSEFIEIG